MARIAGGAIGAFAMGGSALLTEYLDHNISWKHIVTCTILGVVGDAAMAALYADIANN